MHMYVNTSMKYIHDILSMVQDEQNMTNWYCPQTRKKKKANTSELGFSGVRHDEFVDMSRPGP